MVREDEAAGRARDAGVRRGRVPYRAGALERDVRELDEQHPGLEHLAAAVVGAPDSGLHLREWAPVGGPRGPSDVSEMRRYAVAGSRRARHLVLVVAVAVRDVRLARPDTRTRALLSRPHARYRPRHLVLLVH